MKYPPAMEQTSVWCASVVTLPFGWSPIESSSAMTDFFKGWRRKAGCVTLALVCVFVGMWVRSLIFQDAVSILNGQHTAATLLSVDGCIGWAHHHDQYVVRNSEKWTTGTSYNIHDQLRIDRWTWVTRNRWRWRLYGFG